MTGFQDSPGRTGSETAIRQSLFVTRMQPGGYLIDERCRVLARPPWNRGSGRHTCEITEYASADPQRRVRSQGWGWYLPIRCAVPRRTGKGSSMKGTIFHVTGWILTLLLVFAVTGLAQDYRGKIEGLITDESKAVVGGASVTLLNVNTGIRVVRKTSDTG